MVKFAILFLSMLMTSAQANDWKKFHEEDGIELLKSIKNNEGIVPFKATAVLDFPYQQVLEALLDHEKKKDWAPKLKTVKMHKQINTREFIFSEYYKTPWPSTDREFYLHGKVVKKGTGHYILEAISEEGTEYIDDDHIQCDVSYLNFEIQGVGSKTKISFSFLGDMKGWMPIWLINIIQKKWPLRFIQGLRQQISSGKTRKTNISSQLLL